VPPPKPLCQVLLRINSQDEKWINSATVKFEGRPWPAIQTDAAGRALFSLVKGETVQGSVGASGFETTKFSVGCLEARVQEKTLTLLKN
jgi:hypothetical protein